MTRHTQNELEFIKAKFRGRVTLDSREVSDEEWLRFAAEYRNWEKRYEGRLHTMDAGMSQPNPPNYMFANND